MEESKRDQFKSLKQSMSTAQINIKKSLKANEFPEINDIDIFINLSKEMYRLCENEWPDEMNKYMVLLEKLTEAVDLQNQHHFHEIFLQLLERKVSCHKLFRKK